MASGRIAKRVSFRRQMAFGSGLASLSILGFACFHSSMWQLAIGSAVFGLGLGFVYSTMTNVIVQTVLPSQTGAASGMNANIRTIGGAIGTAAMTAIVTSHRQPGGFPAEQGFTNGFLLFALIAAGAMGVCLLLPRPVGQAVKVADERSSGPSPEPA